MSQNTMQFQARKTTNFIAVHCAATDSQEVDIKEIDVWHRQRGFLCVGYHFVIKRSGEVQTGRHVNAVGAHVAGYNSQSIGICMVGGGSKKENNNFTPEQWASLDMLLRSLKHEYPSVVIQGHRDFPNVAKWCPSFDVKAWVSEKGI
jgi:N-acetyl-anhydromuramyl-L-alanine amidase AmpD